MVLVLALGTPAHAFAPGTLPGEDGRPDSARETDYPDNPVSDYLDPRAEGLVPEDVTETLAPSATPAHVTTPAAAPGAPPRKAEWLLVPIPTYNPTLGFIAVGVGGYIFPLDQVSRPSTLVGVGFYSSNNSWGAMLASKLNLAADRYRVTTGLFVGQFNYDFYGIGTEAGNNGLFVPLEQKIGAGLVQMVFRLAPHVYLGPRYVVARIRTGIDTSRVEIPEGVVPPDGERTSWSSAPGLRFQWDTRDSEFYPRRGQLVDVTLDYHATWAGDGFDYLAARIACNQYVGFGDRHVLAFREFVRFVTANAPFYALPRLGQQSDIRGYKTGRYQDSILLATQVEYRLNILAWLGATAFLGVGEVAPDVSSFNFSNLLPAGGLGVRITVAKQNQVNLRADVAFSREGVSFYLAVGEAF
jgi:outer membrane protein assembly factor BamA